MENIVACHDPALLTAPRAFASALVLLPDPRNPLPVLLAMLLVAEGRQDGWTGSPNRPCTRTRGGCLCRAS